jgi:type II secretory pathway component GspD/PulD (secretin)
MASYSQTAAPADTRIWFFDADDASVGDVARSISDFYGVSVLLSGDLQKTKVTGRVVAKSLPESLDALSFYTGQKWRLAPGGAMYYFGGSKEKVIENFPSYGLKPSELGQLLQGQGTVIADRVVAEMEPGRLSQVREALKPMSQRPSMVLEVWIVETATNAIERINAWLNTMTLGVGLAAGKGPMAGLPVGVAAGNGLSSALQGVVDASALFKLMDKGGVYHVELREQVSILSGGQTRFTAGQVLADTTYLSVGQTSGQVASQITRRTVGLELTLQGVAMGELWHLSFGVKDGDVRPDGTETTTTFDGERRVRPGEGYFLLGSFTRKIRAKQEKLVPVLSELKWIGRGFRTAQMDEQERSVLILARPVLVTP